ncbi:BtpA/SgcQ family protein [Thermanaerothrix sp. 4228-RoL]|jgi:membrane complex biogenesis BtpA family protein|uniref:BtpA/SgcQ family protein n=1 Tax=Thermanaerothrix solaris TaxID=3058434 RepID=A0ABU3NRH9_9CHLR|nr:BtpA/SgcQ family protein [Thermanaerothrix sp. 4228-RoL]MDT8899431.1 BtpA/SgcQ family protein [Thermanaerothrix sp. 4228-RoL]
MGNLFVNKKPIIGMIHLSSLPGSYRFSGDLDKIYCQALWEAKVLEEAGVDAVIVENFNDMPYRVGEPDPIDFALIAAITREVKNAIRIPVGVNIQFNAWRSELSIAHACGADFIRVEVFVDTVVTAQGIVLPCSSEIMRYRRSLGSAVQIWADIQTKHSINLVPKALTQSAIEAQEAGADAIIVTGEATGKATPLESIIEVKNVVSVPVLAGSGINLENVTDVMKHADGVIVGSFLKENGVVSNPVSPERARLFVQTARS